MKWLHTAAALAASVSLMAQAPPSSPTKKDGVVEQRAQTMREHIDSGRQVMSHVRVVVRLKNGNKLRGVVKDGRLIERVDGLRFVDALAQEAGAGVRLWYSSGVRNYVFVPFAQFAEYEVLERLSSKQLEEMEKGLQMEEARRVEREAAAARLAATKDNPPPTAETPVENSSAPSAEQAANVPAPKGSKSKKAGKEAKPTDAADAEAAAGEAAQQRLWFSLLQSYPPAAGWGASKCSEIARRQAVIGTKPSDAELLFVEKFAEWEKACKHFAVEAPAKPGADAGGAPAEPTGRSRRKK